MAKNTEKFKIITNNYDENKNSVVALGLFDGVHLGHRKIIESAVANKEDMNALVFTFTTKNDKPTKKNLQKDIFPLETKIDILANSGIDAIYMPTFDEIKSLSPYDFVKEILHDKLKAKKLFCGEDFKFGYKASGDVQYLKDVCKPLGIKVCVIAAKCYRDDDKISSTDIRNALISGDIKLANDLLGFDYFINEEVVHGRHLGRTIDSPTINQKFSADVVVPKYGVYISVTELEDKPFPSITNIGVKPTVESDGAPLSETHIIGINRDLYGKKIKVRFKEFLREEQKFADINELSERIHSDIEKSKGYFK